MSPYSFWIILVVPPIIGYWVLYPVNRQAARLQAPRQFFLTDFVWLMVLLQFALGFAVNWIGTDQKAYFRLVLGFLFISVVGMWAASVSFCSRAGVVNPYRRATFIVVLLPVTLLHMVCTSVALIFLLSAGIARWDLAYRGMTYLHDLQTNVAWWLVYTMAAAALPLAWILRKVGQWTVTGSGEQATPVLVAKPKD